MWVVLCVWLCTLFTRVYYFISYLCVYPFRAMLVNGSNLLLLLLLLMSSIVGDFGNTNVLARFSNEFIRLVLLYFYLVVFSLLLSVVIIIYGLLSIVDKLLLLSFSTTVYKWLLVLLLLSLTTIFVVVDVLSLLSRYLYTSIADFMPNSTFTSFTMLFGKCCKMYWFRYLQYKVFRFYKEIVNGLLDVVDMIL